MQNEEKILIYLQNITAGIDSLQQENREISRKIDRLEERVDAVERSLNERIDAVEKSLNERIDAVEKRIDAVEKSLNERIDAVERSLNEKIEFLNRRIDAVEKSLSENIENSHEALLGLITHNKENIELLLIPLNDRNIHIKGEVDKIPDIERRLGEVEHVVGNHSEAIRRLSYA